MKTETTNLDKSVGSQFSEIKSLISGAMEDLLKAAQKVVSLLDEKDCDMEQIAEGTELPISFIKGLEKVGRKRWHHELFFAESPGKKALRSLPFDLQERFLSKPVKLLIFKNDKPEELNVAIDSLSKDQAAQVFEGKRLRDLGEQRAWIEGYKLRKVQPSEASLPYRIITDALVIVEPCRLKRKELIKILAEIDR